MEKSCYAFSQKNNRKRKVLRIDVFVYKPHDNFTKPIDDDCTIKLRNNYKNANFTG